MACCLAISVIAEATDEDTVRRTFEAYQYLGPALMTPLAAWLWWRHYDGQMALTAIALLVPIAYAYIVPGIGTNLLRVWEIDTRFRLGRFRPHHGFVFGSATAMLALPAMGTPTPGATLRDAAASGIAVALILGAVNWLYDALAIKAGILKVYNQPWADGRGPWSIATDYAPWFFGAFGLIYAAGLKLAEGALLQQAASSHATSMGFSFGLAWGSGLLAATLFLPSLGYIAQSYLRHGHHGCRPIARNAQPTAQP
jgi:hypothetical protein